MQGPGAKRSDCHASWRDVLPIHPAAEMVEAATNQERRVLRGDLKQHGQREPVVLVRIGQGCEQLLDGRTRLDLQEANGDDVIRADGKLTVPHRIVELPDDAAAISYVLSLNLFRRHLTLKQKRELIDKLLKAMPEKSNRQIAKTVGVSHPHVAKVRKALEKSGDVETVTTSVDTKGRQQPAKKSRREAYPKEQVTAPKTTTFEVGAELKDLVATKAPGWTGAIVGTQAEVDTAEGRFRDDGTRGHWLIVAPCERLVIDYRVIQWLLLTAPPPPVLPHMEWALDLCSAAGKARCPAWVSERLTGKSHPQRPGMTWPRELPIPREMRCDDIGSASSAEIARKDAEIEELRNAKRQLESKIAGLESEIEELRGKVATETGGDMPISEFQAAIRKWEDTVEAQKNIIRDLQNENAKLRAGVAASPADDGLDIPDWLRRAAP